jgi:hypothetical protein
MPNTLTELSLSQAAKACNRSKSTLLEAIRNGRLSAKKDDKNQWCIEPAELFRAYPIEQQNRSTNGTENRDRTPTEQDRTRIAGLLVREVKLLERERETLMDTIADLRQRLDRETGERQRLTLMLEHQKAKHETPATEEKGRLYAKLFVRDKRGA